MSVRKVKRRYPGTNRICEYWMVDIVYEPLNGEPIRIRRKSPVQNQKGAEKYEREVRFDLANGVLDREEGEEPVPTLEEFSSEFVQNYAVANNKPSEVESKKMIFKVHLVPDMGKFTLDKIGPRQVERYKAKKLRQNLAPATVNNHLGVLSKMLGVAVEWGIIDHVPKIKRLREPEPEFDFLDFDEAERLLEAFKNTEPRHHALFHTVLKSGMRSGEFLALRWQDVDLVAGKILVRQNFVRGKISTPKSHKSRVIELGNDAIAVLKAHRHLKSEIVFCSPDGTIQTKNMIRRPLNRACKKAGLRNITWRDIRHTFASHLVMKGAPLKTVQELMGHADIKTTMRYAHLSQSARRDAAKLLDRDNSYGSIAAT